MLLSKLGLLLFFGVASQSAYAAGYALIEQSITGLGRAFSGSAAVADDASTIFFNPAGLTQLDKSELNLGLNFIVPYARFNDAGSTHPTGDRLRGGRGGDAAEDAVVPNFYYAHRVNETVVLGLGIGAPFGLVTDYDRDWQGRYQAQRSELKTVNINPSIAFKATKRLSLGAGVSLQYADIELSQAVDFGRAFGQPQNFDGQAKLVADSWSGGYNLGLTYQFTEATRGGMSYRSKIVHDLKGKGRFRIPNNPTAQAVAAGGAFTDGKVEGRVTLPESLSLALHHQINAQWSVMADASWTRWSRFETLKINSDVERLASEKSQDWQNTWRYGIGLEFQASDKWAFRTGVAYDETPVPNQFRRTPRIPDNDRKWFALGASYQYSENLVVDAAYAHLFMSQSKIDDTDANGYRLVGDYDSHVDLVGVQLRWIFD